MAELIDGKQISNELLDKLKHKIEQMEQKPCLAVILVGEDPASKMFVRIKGETSAKIGMEFKRFDLQEHTTQQELTSLIEKLNADNAVHGIVVQLPLPKHLDREKVALLVAPEKDVDCLHPLNIGRLMEGHQDSAPCTPKGIMMLLKYHNIEITGKEVVIINRSNLIGKPMALMMLKESATVNVCHSKTKDISKHTKDADIIVTATGVPNLIKADMVKEGVVVIDAGTSVVDGKAVGDVDFEAVKEKASYITPVPGGVGPITVATLLENTIVAAQQP